MFDIEILKNLQRVGTILFSSWYCIEYLLKSLDYIFYDKLVFLVNKVAVLFIFFTENPSVHSFCYRYLFLSEQTK